MSDRTGNWLAERSSGAPADPGPPGRRDAPRISVRMRPEPPASRSGGPDLSVSIPQPFRARVEGPIGPVSVSGIPSNFTFTLGDPLPKVSVGIDPLKVGIEPLKTDSHVAIDALKTDSKVAVDPLTVRLDPLNLSIGIDRIPDVRAHLPASFSLSLCVLGIQLVSIRLCGEAQVITEPYTPGPCEGP
jgi:hypothetical protein